MKLYHFCILGFCVGIFLATLGIYVNTKPLEFWMATVSLWIIMMTLIHIKPR